MRNGCLRTPRGRRRLRTEDALLSPHHLDLHTSDRGKEREKGRAGRPYLERAQYSLPLTLTPQSPQLSLHQEPKCPQLLKNYWGEPDGGTRL